MSNIDGRAERLRRRREAEAAEKSRQRVERRRPPAEPLRPVDLVRVKTLRSLLERDGFFGYENETLGLADLPDLAAQLSKTLTGVSSGVWFETLRPLVGYEFTPEFIRELSWQFAGNASTLRSGTPCRSWTAQRINEWVPAQILKVSSGRNYRDQSGQFLNLRVLAGTPSGKTLGHFWSDKQCAFYAHTMGFSQRHARGKNAIRMQRPSEFTLMRLYIYLSVDQCREGLSFTHFRVPAGMREFNIELMKKRRRIDFKCPKGYVHPCHACVVGYDRCKVACHPSTYVRRMCPECQTAQLFDPDRRSQVCIACSGPRR